MNAFLAYLIFKEWKTLEEDSAGGIVPGFGKKLNNILSQNLAR
jgi:hypothetical protein